MLVIAEERARAEEAEAECDNLKHDIARYVEIASEHATEVERLRGLLEEIADLESYTRVGGATVGDLGSYEAGLNEALELARAALKGDGNG